MECSKIKDQLIDYLYDELTPEGIRTVKEHLERCAICREELELLQRVHQRLNSWEEVIPASGLSQKLQEQLAQARFSIKMPGSIWQRPLFKVGSSTACGTLTAILSVLVLSRNIPPTNLSPKSLLICGILWSAAYSILFCLAFLGIRTRREEASVQEPGSYLFQAAMPALAAILIATLIAFLILSESPQLKEIKLFLNNLLNRLSNPTRYFLLGSMTSLFSLFIGSLILGRPLSVNPLGQGPLAACLFTMAIAPALSVLCIPFTLGLYTNLLFGSFLGALTGGTLGSWLGVSKI